MRTLTFLEVLNDDYPDGVWIEPKYRGALDLEKQKPARVTIARKGLTESGNPRTRGIKHPDRITFQLKSSNSAG